MEEMRIVFAGFGGQGLLFAGKVIAYAGLIDEHEVSWLPSYGPEMRGGTANCSVTLSDEPIGSPLVMNPNILVAMNQPSLLRFEDKVTTGGIVLVDSSLVSSTPSRKDITVFSLEATNLAEDAGLKGLANIVLVGKMLVETQFTTTKTLEKAIHKTVPRKKEALISRNIQALKLGMEQ